MSGSNVFIKENGTKSRCHEAGRKTGVPSGRNPSSGLLESNQEVAGVGLFAFLEKDFFEGSGFGGGDGGEHLHGFEDDEFIAFGNFVSGFDGNLADHASEEIGVSPIVTFEFDRKERLAVPMALLEFERLCVSFLGPSLFG